MIDPEPTRILVEKARDGDRAAFDTLVAKFRSRLRSRVESWSQFQLGPRLDVDEVLQDTFIQAFRGLARFEWQHDDDAFFRWVCGVAKNVIAGSARDARRAARKAGNQVDIGDLPTAGPTPSQVLQRGERFDRLRAALDKLSPDYRKVLLLSRLEGLTMRDIAERMDRTPNAVKHLISRALLELRKHFGDTESLHLADGMLKTEESKDGE